MRALPWILATLVIAVLVHLGTVCYLPQFVMGRAMAQMGAVNTMHHGARATAEIHGVVRPSPDLLYSVCPFDLSHGPLHVTALVPAGTYWSVSIFDDATNNFFVRNDRQVKDGKLDIVVYDKSNESRMLTSPGMLAHFIQSPSAHGLVVFRTLIDAENNLASIDATRRQASCTTTSPSWGGR